MLFSKPSEGIRYNSVRNAHTFTFYLYLAALTNKKNICVGLESLNFHYVLSKDLGSLDDRKSCIALTRHSMVTPFLLIIRMTWQKVYLQFYFLTCLETKCTLSMLKADFWFISHSFNGYLLQSSFWLVVKVCFLTTLRAYSHLSCLVRLNRTQVNFPPWCRSFGQQPYRDPWRGGSERTLVRLNGWTKKKKKLHCIWSRPKQVN